MKSTMLLAVLAIFISSFMLFSPQASALTAAQCQKGSFFGLPTWYKNLKFGTDCKIELATKTDPKGNVVTDIGKTAAGIGLAVFEILLRIGGMVAVAFVIWGGFQFITSQGEPDRAKSARGTILNAVIGLAITLIAAPLVSFLATKLITP